jgi:hypothetical protein
MDDVLRRFHQVLLEEIRDRRPEYLDGPFTVAEIYQNLAPYGTHRDRIGVDINGDYEDALLRLLAGEGDYLRLESEHALRDLRAELESSNPNTGLYREFAAVDVRLGAGVPSAPASDASPPANPEGFFQAPSSSGEDPVSVDDLAPAREPSAAQPAAQGQASPELQGPAVAAAACPWCRAELPRRRELNFCPFCGTDMHYVPCSGCGEELEPDWRFCIACGTEVSA